MLKKEVTYPGECIALQERDGDEPPSLRDHSGTEQYYGHAGAGEMQSSAGTIGVLAKIKRIEIVEAAKSLVVHVDAAVVVLFAPIQCNPKPRDRKVIEWLHVCLQLPQSPKIVVMKLNSNRRISIETANLIVDRDGDVKQISTPATIDKARLGNPALNRRYCLYRNMHGVPILLS